MAARWSDRTRFAVTVLLVLLPTLAWAVATPRYAAPDERDHAIKAAGVVRGHPVLDRVPGFSPGWGQVELPASFGQSDIGCFAYTDEVTAACMTFTDEPGSSVLQSRARVYPPLYYAVVGLPSLAFTDTRALYPMRFLSAVLVSVLVAMAAWLLRRTAAPRLAAVGLLVAFTPMAVYVNAGLNPSGLEISAALLFWVSGYLVMTRGPTDRLLLVSLAISGSLLVLSRPLSWLWLGLIGLALMVVGGWRGVRRLLGSGGGRWAVGIVAAAGAVQAVYIVWTGSLTVDDPGTGVDASTSEIVRTSVGRVWDQVRQMIGLFGYLDTVSPALVYVGWLFLVGALLLLAWCVAGRRLAWLIGALVVATVVVPVLLEVRAAPDGGYLWQGRYTLPLAIGIPLLCGFVLAASPTARALAGRRLPWIAMVVVGVSQVAAFYFALRRYSVSVLGSVFPWVEAEWWPPGGVVPVLVWGTVSFALLVWWLAGVGRFSLYGSVQERSVRVEVVDGSVTTSVADAVPPEPAAARR